jgi:metallo-beta-lactamase class B
MCAMTFMRSNVKHARTSFNTVVLSLFVASMLLASAPCVQAQAAYPGLPIRNPAYVQPFQPLRILGNLYYVGTYDLAVYLITTPEGHILVNTGVNDSTPAIRANIEALGFKFSDIKVLLATHGHWDHVGAMAEIKRLTGARMLMHEGDADLLESDERRDELHLLHARGRSQLQRADREHGVDQPRRAGELHARFSGIMQAYKGTITRQKQLKPDVWVSSHAGHFNLHDKYKPGDSYNPNRFVDPNGYQAKLAFYEKLIDANLAKDQKAQQLPDSDLAGDSGSDGYPFTLLLKKSTVRCHESLAALSS